MCAAGIANAVPVHRAVFLQEGPHYGWEIGVGDPRVTVGHRGLIQVIICLRLTIENVVESETGNCLHVSITSGRVGLVREAYLHRQRRAGNN